MSNVNINFLFKDKGYRKSYRKYQTAKPYIEEKIAFLNEHIGYTFSGCIYLGHTKYDEFWLIDRKAYEKGEPINFENCLQVDISLMLKFLRQSTPKPYLDMDKLEAYCIKCRMMGYAPEFVEEYDIYSEIEESSHWHYLRYKKCCRSILLGVFVWFATILVIGVSLYVGV